MKKSGDIVRVGGRCVRRTVDAHHDATSHQFGLSCDGVSDLTANHARSFYIENVKLRKDETIEPTTNVCL